MRSLQLEKNSLMQDTMSCAKYDKNMTTIAWNWPVTSTTFTLKKEDCVLIREENIAVSRRYRLQSYDEERRWIWRNYGYRREKNERIHMKIGAKKIDLLFTKTTEADWWTLFIDGGKNIGNSFQICHSILNIEDDVVNCVFHTLVIPESVTLGRKNRETRPSLKSLIVLWK